MRSVRSGPTVTRRRCRRGWPGTTPVAGAADGPGDGGQLLPGANVPGTGVARQGDRWPSCATVLRSRRRRRRRPPGDEPRHRSTRSSAVASSVVVGPLAHHVEAQRAVGDVAATSRRTRRRSRKSRYSGKRLPLAPRHALVQGACRGCPRRPPSGRSALVHASGAHRGEADAAVAHHDGRDAVGGRRLEGVVPGDLAGQRIRRNPAGLIDGSASGRSTTNSVRWAGKTCSLISTAARPFGGDAPAAQERRPDRHTEQPALGAVAASAPIVWVAPRSGTPSSS